MSDEVNRLRETLDALWAELPVDVVLALDADIVAACKENHDALWHDRESSDRS